MEVHCQAQNSPHTASIWATSAVLGTGTDPHQVPAPRLGYNTDSPKGQLQLLCWAFLASFFVSDLVLGTDFLNDLPKVVAHLAEVKIYVLFQAQEFLKVQQIIETYINSKN